MPGESDLCRKAPGITGSPASASRTAATRPHPPATAWGLPGRVLGECITLGREEETRPLHRQGRTGHHNYEGGREEGGRRGILDGQGLPRSLKQRHKMAYVVQRGGETTTLDHFLKKHRPGDLHTQEPESSGGDLPMTPSDKAGMLLCAKAWEDRRKAESENPHKHDLTWEGERSGIRSWQLHPDALPNRAPYTSALPRQRRLQKEERAIFPLPAGRGQIRGVCLLTSSRGRRGKSRTPHAQAARSNCKSSMPTHIPHIYSPTLPLQHCLNIEGGPNKPAHEQPKETTETQEKNIRHGKKPVLNRWDIKHDPRGSPEESQPIQHSHPGRERLSKMGPHWEVGIRHLWMPSHWASQA